MAVVQPRARVHHGPAAIGLAVALALVGCKSEPNNSKSSDPLVTGPRIPPQNVPVPERGIGANGKDPLLGTPVKPVDKTGVGYTDDPSRFKQTYLPGPGSTPAALAVGNAKDGDGLKIDGNENRVPLQPAAGTQLPPSLPSVAGSPVAGVPPSGNSLDALYRELDARGCKATDRSLVQENGQYTFRASIPRAGSNGAKLQCTAVGATPEDAVRQVLDTVASDHK